MNISTESMKGFLNKNYYIFDVNISVRVYKVGGGQNWERPIFRNLKIANIKIMFLEII